MDSFQSVLGDAAGGALCSVLSAYGSSAPLLTAISLIEPTPIGEGLAVSAGLAGLAATVGCSWDTNGQGPPDGPTDGFTGCKKFSQGYGKGIVSTVEAGDITAMDNVIEVFRFGPPGPGNSPGYTNIPLNYLAHIPGNDPREIDIVYTIPYQVTGLSVEPKTSDAKCEEPAPIGPPEPPTYVHKDPDSGCEINVNFKGWGLREGGNVSGIWEMTPKLSSLQASGGVIGGCNFAPVIYVDGGGSGNGGGGGGGYSVPVPDPVPPSGDEPWWAPLARGAVQGAATAATQALLDKLLETPYPGGNYELKGVCERDPNGHPMDVTRSTNFPPAPGINAVLHRLDALADMFQFDKDLRQPTCKVTPTLTGEWVTVNFISDKASPGGERPLRKELRYRDQTGSDLKVHLDHWVDFTWQAGPVIVISKNLSWGTPQVWASTIQEGKRVIGHAAQVAGVDLSDPAHEWVISGTDDPRYGRTGTMRLDTRGGLFMRVTKRPSPSGLPYGYSPEA